MKRVLIPTLVILGLALAASIYFCVTLNQDKNAMADELESTQGVLASTQAELTTTQDNLAASQTELDATKDTLTSTSSELSATQDTLASAQSELETTSQTLVSTQSELETTSQTLTLKLVELSTANDEIDSLEEDLTNLESALSSSQYQLAIAEDTLSGLGITTDISSECRDVELIDNPEAENPTWSELISFLEEDQTEQNDYILEVYDCSQFSRDVHNNAEAAGIRAAEVQVWFRNENTGHALNAFITTDYGLVYVDCTQEPDTFARVKVDKDYRAVGIYSISGQNARNDAWWDSQWPYYYLSSETGVHSIVSEIMIYW